MDICVDFDGTCVTHDYPNVGAEIGAVEVLKKLVAKNHRLIIFTMRSGKELNDAYNWFTRHAIPVYGIQSNPTQILWTSSPKAYGQLYIDDAALGCPLTQKDIELEEDTMERFHYSNKEKDGKHFYAPKRPYVNWTEVEKILKDKKVL